MAHIGLYFGSFNPIHHGHLIIAQHMLNTSLFDSIRFVVSPRNPFKNESELFDQHLRLEMAKAAANDNPGFEVSDAEFHLPIPSYTIQTLRHFQSTEPGTKFSIIMGSDNLEKLHEWKEIENISEICDFHIYNRIGSAESHPKIDIEATYYRAPYLDISATFIRHQMQQQKSVKYLVPDAVLKLLSENTDD